MKQLIKKISKKSLATMLFALPAVTVFAASNVSQGNSHTMAYVVVIGFFTSLVATLLFPFEKVNSKSLLA